VTLADKIKMIASLEEWAGFIGQLKSDGRWGTLPDADKSALATRKCELDLAAHKRR